LLIQILPSIRTNRPVLDDKFPSKFKSLAGTLSGIFFFQHRAGKNNNENNIVLPNE
jgi:hypothetical protein